MKRQRERKRKTNKCEEERVYAYPYVCVFSLKHPVCECVFSLKTPSGRIKRAEKEKKRKERIEATCEERTQERTKEWKSLGCAAFRHADI